MHEKRVVERIKETRLSLGLVLEELAKKTGFTKGYLSKVENSDKAPPVSTLTRIAQALGVNISTFFEEEIPTVAVNYYISRQENRPTVSRLGSEQGYLYESLAAGFPKRLMDPYVVELPSKSQQTTYQHNGQEMFFILEGSVRVIYGEIEFVLKQGDCCYFNSDIPHNSYSLENKPAKALMIFSSNDCLYPDPE